MAGLCPPAKTLSHFAAGRLSAEGIEEVAAHLESCVACQSALETVNDHDELMQALCESEEAEHFSQEAACACFVEQLAVASRTECETRLSTNKASADAESNDTVSGGDSGPHAPEQAAAVRFGQYVLLRQIGRGGMGAVYQALHTHLERIVAIKMLASDRMKDADAVARFEREMRAVGRLEHPQIVRAMDAGKHDDVSYLVMEYVHGPDLSAVVNGVGPLRVADACEIARQVAVGLDYAFRRGLVHRDIKPSNMMIDVGVDALDASFNRKPQASASIDAPQTPDVAHADGLRLNEGSDPAVVRILDFGLALLEENRGVTVAGISSSVASGELTSAGQLMGTLDYIAPEQVGSSHDVDVRADIYGLGATLFKLLTGYAPFATDEVANPAKRIARILAEEARSVAELRGDLPSELVTVVSRMLARDPAARIQTPTEVIAALAPFVAGADLKRLALEVWNPKTTLVTMTSLPSILAKQRELLDATLPHLQPDQPRPALEATTDRLRHDETGADWNRDASRSTQEGSRDGRESSATEKLKTAMTANARRRTITRWVASLAVLATLAALSIPKWRTSESNTNVGVVNTAPPPRPPAKPLVIPFDAATADVEQRAWAEELGVPAEFENSIGMKFRVIPPGRFTMGLTPEEVEEIRELVGPQYGRDLLNSAAKQREVTLTKPFAMGVTEVTVAQFMRFVDATGYESQLEGRTNNAWRQLITSRDPARLPIGFVTWHDALAFTDWLSRKEKVTYSLPTEAEWEFACRAGSIGPWGFAEEIELEELAWANLAQPVPHPVGVKRANPFGLHDMIGNVAEWCHDNFLLAAGTEPVSDPPGPPFSDNRALRGGSVQSNLGWLRAGMRDGVKPTALTRERGFRLVRQFDDSPNQRQKSVRPARDLADAHEPLGDNAIEVGMRGYVAMPSLKWDSAGPITIEAFVTPHWTEFRGTRHVAGIAQQCSLFVTPDPNGAGWSLGLSRADRFQGLMSPARLEEGRRVHVAGVRDGQIARVFVDGKLVMKEDESPSPLSASQAGFSVGGLDATIDEVRVSNVARYVAEFTPQTRFEPDEQTLGLWHFDEGTGSLANDSSGHGHHGTLMGAMWLLPSASDETTAPQVAVEPGPTRPKITFTRAEANANNALLFGNNSRVTVPSLKLDRPSQLTIEMFATLTGEQGTGWRILGGFAYQSRILTGLDGKLCFANELARKRGNGYFWAGLPVRGQRFHLAGVIEDDTLRFFVNGHKAAVRRVPNFELARPGTPFTLGAHADGEFGFPGVIDEVRLSSVARYREDFDPVEQLDADEQTLALYHCDEMDGDRLIDSSGHEHHGRVLGATRLKADSLQLEWPQPADVVYLDDLPEAEVDVHPEFGKHGLDHDGNPIEWRSQRPPHTLMVHPHANGTSHVVYDLGGKYELFEGLAAITSNDSFGWRPTVPLTFRVLGDDKLLWTSPPLKAKGAGQEFRIAVRGVRQLRLETACPGDNTGAHCFWLAPRLRTKESLEKSAPVNVGANPAATMTVEPAAANENNALLFQDQSSVLVNSLKPPSTSDLTIECFVTVADDRSGDWQFFVGWPGQPRLLKLPNGRLAFGLQTTGGRAAYVEGPRTKVGERLHLAGVLAGTTARLFVDGVKVSEQTLELASIGEQGRAFAIGARPGGSYQFAGLIDEVRLSTVARYREDFAPSERFDPDEHTLVLFHCDELDNEQLLDSSSHEHHGQIRGATRVRADSLKLRTPRDTANADQPLPAGLQFDGVNDFVSIPSLQVDGHGPYTLEVWLWQKQQQTQQFPVAMWGSSAGIQLQSNNGKSFFDGIGTSDESSVVQILQPPWPVRRRIHLAFCWQEQNRMIFVDGRKQMPQSQLYPRDDAKPTPGTHLGARSFPPARVINHFAGRMDELRLSNTIRYTQDFSPLDEFINDDSTLALYKFDEGDGSELRDSSGHQHHGRIFGATWVPAIEPTNSIDSTDSQSLAPRTLTPEDGWVELGSKCRIPDDVVAGTWQLDETTLESLGETLPGHPPRLLLPLVPTGGYELEFTVTRLTGDGAIAAHLPVGAGECVLQLDNTWPGHSERIAGLQFINGERVFSDQNLTRTVLTFENNRAYRVTARVELLDDQSARLRIHLDDKLLVDWFGQQSSLGADPRWRRDPLGLGTSDVATARFENIRCRVLSDQARLLR